MNRDSWNQLVGKHVASLWLSPDGECVFVCDNQGAIAVLVARMDSDCCSETWVGDIINVPALVGQTVRAVRMLDLPADKPDMPARVYDDSRTHQEAEQYFGVELETEKGHCTIVARNSSNGYYGGCLEGLSELEEVPTGSKPITDDFSG